MVHQAIAQWTPEPPLPHSYRYSMGIEKHGTKLINYRGLTPKDKTHIPLPYNKPSCTHLPRGKDHPPLRSPATY